MNNTNSPATGFVMALAAACALSALAASPALAQDKPKPGAAKKAEAKDEKDTRDRKIYVDNEKVLVSEVRYKPGAASGQQDRSDRVVRVMAGGTLERTFTDGRKETIEYKTGEVRFNPKERYSQKNTGKSEIVLFVVTLKEKK